MHYNSQAAIQFTGIATREVRTVAGKGQRRYMHMIGTCVRALRCSEQELQSLLEGTEIEPEQLRQPYSMLSRDRELRFYRNLLQCFPEPGLGLRLGGLLSLRELGPIGLAGLTSRKLLESIETSRKYLDLLLPYLRWDLVVGEKELVHRVSNKGEAPPELRTFFIELLLSVLKGHGQEHFGPACLPTRVSLSYPDPGYRGRYERTFECAVRFRQPANELRYPRHFLEMDLRQPDPLTRTSMETLCEDLASRLQVEAEIVEDVIAVLRAAGPDIPTQQQAAATLCISARSMRRQLKEQGQSFRSLVDEVRMRRALEGLRDPAKSIREIAEACGFSELRGFYSAFQRWTGVSPAAWRKAQLGPADPADD